MEKADILLKSSSIYTATGEKAKSGFVAIRDNRIQAVGKLEDSEAYMGKETKVYELGEKLVCPGAVDVHCFFTGYVLGFVGVDMGKVKTEVEAIDIVRAYGKNIGKTADGEWRTIFGHGYDPEKLRAPKSDLLDRAFSDQPVVLFAKAGEICWMNKAAEKKFDFTPERCYPEAYWRLLGEVLTDKPFIKEQFKAYMEMMNARGITAVKEMGFDDFYGFTEILDELEKEQALTLRISYMSQPVGRGADLPYGKRMSAVHKGPFLTFSGYNRMTDGSISCLCGDLKKPYNCAPGMTCGQEIDYEMIEKEVLAADEAGFRFSLHVQGDGAVEKALDIFEKCKKEDGKLKNRHAMTDLEFTDPVDLERMGRLGVTAEIYPQIMSLGTAVTKIPMIEEKIGKDRGRYYWNRRKMADSGVTISCGTDLPLLIPDIPESIYHSVGGYFPEGGAAFNKENTLTREEVLTAWTKGGQQNLGMEKELGTIEVGKLADIAVFSGNLFETNIEKIREEKCVMTIVDGKVVYEI